MYKMAGKYKRTTKILNRKFINITIPAILAELCTIACVATDSVVAQHYIDNRAVAAIALLATFFTVFEIIHDLLGSCTTILITRIKCEVSNEEASKTFADIVVIVLFVYVFITLILLAGGRFFLEFLTDDRSLVNMAWTYFVPLLIASPLLELLLIIERGLKTEGNAAYFAARPIISNALNILLDILFVVSFGKGIIWLSFATIISSALGYVWSISYPFFRHCNIGLNFKGILSLRRLINTAQEQIKIGKAYFLGDIIELVNTGVIAKLTLMFGGSIAMVSYGIMKNIITIVYGFVFPIVGNSNIILSALFAEQDKKGIIAVCRRTLILILVFSGIFLVLMAAFPEMFAYIYDVAGGEQFRNMTVCMGTLGFCILWEPLGFYIRAALISIKKEHLSTILAVVEQLLQLVLVLAAALTGNITVIWIAMGWSTSIYVIVFAFIAFRKKRYARELPASDIVGYTCRLDNKSASTISEDVCELLIEKRLSETVSRKIGLTIEECSMLIIKNNEGRDITADVRVRIAENGLKVYFYYDGNYVLSETELSEETKSELDNLEKTVLKGITEKIRNMQIVELNCIEFSVKNNQKRI